MSLRNIIESVCPQINNTWQYNTYNISVVFSFAKYAGCCFVILCQSVILLRCHIYSKQLGLLLNIISYIWTVVRLLHSITPNTELRPIWILVTDTSFVTKLFCSEHVSMKTRVKWMWGKPRNCFLMGKENYSWSNTLNPLNVSVTLVTRKKDNFSCVNLS